MTLFAGESIDVQLNMHLHKYGDKKKHEKQQISAENTYKKVIYTVYELTYVYIACIYTHIAIHNIAYQFKNMYMYMYI